MLSFDARRIRVKKSNSRAIEELFSLLSSTQQSRKHKIEQRTLLPTFVDSVVKNEKPRSPTVIDPVPNSRNMTSDTDFVFVTREILGQKPGSPLLKAFEHSAISDGGNIMTLSERTIHHPQYMDDSSAPPTRTELEEGYQ